MAVSLLLSKYSWEAFLAGFVLIFFAVPWLNPIDDSFPCAVTVSLVIADSFFQGPIKVRIGALSNVLPWLSLHLVVYTSCGLAI